MSRATPQMLHFARRLIDYETNGNGAFESPGREAYGICQKLRPHLATLMGNGGVRGLFARALALASAEVPWLSAVHVKTDGSLEGMEELHVKRDPGELLEGGVVMVAQLLGLLVAFIGENLTVSLVRDVWPNARLTTVDFGNGVKNEKS